MQGEHDDLVMGLAIAHAIRGQQSYLPEEIRGTAAHTRRNGARGRQETLIFLDWSG